MNFRITTLFFGLLLTTLWIFGLMIAHRKAAGDRGFIVPSLRGEDIKIDKVTVKGKGEKKEFEAVFENINDRWYLKAGKEQVRIEGFRIDGLIRQIKDAKHDEIANVEGVRVVPEVTVTLSGKAKEEAKEWKFLVGKEVAGLVHVASSDQEGKVFAVAKRNLESLLFTDPNHLRSKRLFDFVDTGVTKIIIKKADKELELKREANLWMFIKPSYGLAGFTDEAPPEKKDPHDFKAPPPPQATGGVKALLSSIVNVRVEVENDFVPLGSSGAYGLEAGKERMRIEIVSAEKKDTTSEVLLIGKQNKERVDGVYYFARLADDDGIFQIKSTWLDPIEKAVNDPGKIRSLDIAVFDESKVDVVTLAQGKDEFQFFKTEKDEKDELPFMPMKKQAAWEMIVGKDKKKASDQAVHGLLEQVLGKKVIVEFLDLKEGEDAKKKDAEWGFEAPTAAIGVYVNGIEKEKKEEPKEEQKDKDKKDPPKKEEPKKDPLPALKKDAKAAVKLEFGKSDKETINVKRTLADGTVSRFTLKKDYFDKVMPSEGLALAYMDTALPEFPADAVVALKLERKTEKGTEVLELERHTGDGKAALWYVKDPLEPGGLKLAESNLVDQLVESMSKMHAKKLLKTLDDKEDLEKYGLKTPAAVISLTVKKHPATPASAAGAVAVLAANHNAQLLAASFAIASRQADKGETVSLTLGKETDQDKDKPGTFATHSGSKTLFLVPSQLVKFAKETDFRDRAVLMHAQGRMMASYVGVAAGHPTSLLMLGSPHISGQVLNVDADKVKAVRMEVRDRFELRTFDFVRDPKDKSWTDKSPGLVGFKLDSEKVTQFVKDLAKIKAERFVAFVGGPRGEHRLGAAEVTVKLDITLEDGKTVTLLVGGNHQQSFYATISAMPEAVFMISGTSIEPMLRGAAQFGKERVGAN